MAASKKYYHSIKMAWLIMSCAISFHTMQAQSLRTNGYSDWIEKTVNANVTKSVSAWIALESYPTDTAGIVGVTDKDGNSLCICIDQFGSLLAGMGKAQEYTYQSLNCGIDCFRWVHLLLDVTQGKVFLNGEALKINLPVSMDKTGSLKVVYGKDFHTKKMGPYEVTTINGIIDMARADSLSSEMVFMKADVGQRAGKPAKLAIPESRFANDFNRPKYHLMPAANWTNETHGLIFYNGRYHIFNQKNASGLILSQINWGHFVSSDLINWTELQPAIRPSETYDQKGIWSGCAVINDDGIPQILYTGGTYPTNVSTAFPLDSNLVKWSKYSANPVVADRPTEYERTDMRDPYVWKESDGWYMIVGFGIGKESKQRGTLLLYRSKNLKDWDYRGLLFEGYPEKDNTGVFWEMPVILKLGGKYILSVNRVPHKGIPARTQYWIGEFMNERFIPDNPMPQNLEVINRLLSPSVLKTGDNEALSIAIIPDEVGWKPTFKQGWAHLYSIPRLWTLKNGKICQSPFKGLNDLRKNHQSFKKQSIKEGLLISRKGHQKEIKATFFPSKGENFGFILCKNPDGSEYSKIYYDTNAKELVIDQSHSSLAEQIPLRIRKDSYQLNLSKPVEIHIFIDGSVIEGFINDEDAFTTRIFPQSEKSTQIELFSSGNSTQAMAEVWDMKAADMKTDF